MKCDSLYTTGMFLSLFILLFVENNGVDGQGVGPTQDTCSGLKFNFPAPLPLGNCLSGFDTGKRGVKSYPGDFIDASGNQVLNEVKIYTCPVRKKRVIISNGLPDHDIVLNQGTARLNPCTVNWAVEIPLHPKKASRKLEVPPRGAIAFSINGVPVYGKYIGKYSTFWKLSLMNYHSNDVTQITNQNRYFDQDPWKVIASMLWNHLQVLPKEQSTGMDTQAVTLLGMCMLQV